MKEEKVHVMLDLETFSLRPDALIISIGAVAFTAEGITGTFYSVADMSSYMQKAGCFSVDPQTVMWWMNQTDEARRVFAPHNQTVPIETALDAFATFYKCNRGTLWACGTDFDIPVLKNAYRSFNRQEPWYYSEVSDYRTVRKMFPYIQRERDGVAHNALDDATYQAEHLLDINKVLSPNRNFL